MFHSNLHFDCNKRIRDKVTAEMRSAWPTDRTCKNRLLIMQLKDDIREIRNVCVWYTSINQKRAQQQGENKREEKWDVNDGMKNNLPFKFHVKGQQVARQRSLVLEVSSKRVKKILNYSSAHCTLSAYILSSMPKSCDSPSLFFILLLFTSLLFSVFFFSLSTFLLFSSSQTI